MNIVILSGRLTNDPELRYTKSDNQAVAIFNLATKKGEGTMFVNSIAAFGKTGEFISKYLKKGTMIQLKGRLNDRDIELGDKKYKTYNVIAEEIEFAESKKKEESKEEFIPITDDDMPF